MGAVGPPPSRAGGPEVLIGGYMPAAVERVGRWGDRYGHEGPPSEAAELFRRAEESWKMAGRKGRPRFVGAFHFGLGPNAGEKASATLADYYGFALTPIPRQASASLRELATLRAPAVEAIIDSPPTTSAAVQRVLRDCLAVGTDEVIAYPAIAGLEQVDRLADVVHGCPGL